MEFFNDLKRKSKAQNLVHLDEKRDESHKNEIQVTFNIVNPVFRKQLVHLSAALRSL